MTDRVSVCEAVRQMSDAELVTAAERIRGTSKRGSRRKLTEAETLALAAVYEEQTRRRGRAVTSAECERTVTA